MKKVFFYLCMLLLVLFLPAYAYSVKDIPSNDFKFVKHNQLYISNTTHREHLFMDAYLLEEDSDNGCTSEKEKLSSRKNTYTVTSFVTTDASCNTIKRTWSSNYFSNFSQACPIYFRVLRL